MQSASRFIAFVAVIALVAAAAPADLDSQGRDPQVIELTDATFDATVFGDGAASKPFFIFFYAPWCGHCRSAKPVFRDASSFNLYDADAAQRGRTATFALIDATANTVTAKRYGVRSFPTFVYTIRGRGYKYDSGRGVNDFAMWGRYLDAAHKLGSFADDLSLPSTFTTLMDPKLGFDRANFFFVFPQSKEVVPPEALREMHRVIDETASFGRARFSIIFRGTAEAATSAAEVEQSTKVVALELSHADVLKAADSVPASARTKDGAVLLLATDAFDAPVYCPHAWFNTTASEGAASIEDRVLNSDLVFWMKTNAFRAVEEINSDSFAVLARRGVMIILATNGPTPASDPSRVPVLRRIVRRRNKAGAKSLTFGTLDGTVYQAWLEQFGISNLEDQLPLVFGLDTAKEIVYLLPQPEQHAAIKASKWALGGEQERIIEELLRLIETDAIEGTRYTTIGKVTGVILKFLPFLKPLHAKINGDAEFCAVLFGTLMMIFILAMSFGGPSPAQQQQQQQRQRGGGGRSPMTPASPNATAADMKKDQ